MRGERAEQDGEGGGEERGGGRRGGEEEGELGGRRERRVAEDVEADGERQRRGGQERRREVRRGEEVVCEACGEERVREIRERRGDRGEAADGSGRHGADVQCARAGVLSPCLCRGRAFAGGFPAPLRGRTSHEVSSVLGCRVVAQPRGRMPPKQLKRTLRSRSC